MKKLFILLVGFIFIQCGEDNPVSVNENELLGVWESSKGYGTYEFDITFFNWESESGSVLITGRYSTWGDSIAFYEMTAGENDSCRFNISNDSLFLYSLYRISRVYIYHPPTVTCSGLSGI